jgi:hypothetical protein
MILLIFAVLDETGGDRFWTHIDFSILGPPTMQRRS